jgi:hypothetical protein
MFLISVQQPQFTEVGRGIRFGRHPGLYSEVNLEGKHFIERGVCQEQREGWQGWL